MLPVHWHCSCCSLQPTRAQTFCLHCQWHSQCSLHPTLPSVIPAENTGVHCIALDCHGVPVAPGWGSRQPCTSRGMARGWVGCLQ